jgi:predicted transcriptional regulator
VTDKIVQFIPEEAHAPPELKNVAEQVAQGQRPVVTVRTLLSWFYGSQRRGRWIVSIIRIALEGLNLQTEPDFDATYLDGQVTFVPKSTPETVVATLGVQAELTAGAVVVSAESGPATLTKTPVDPTYRVDRLEIAHRPPLSVPPDAPIELAVTHMLMNDYSQLPVMTSEREVKGMISWKSLGSCWSQGHEFTRVAEAMDQQVEIDTEASIFAVVELLRQNDCVLVRDRTKKINGIITSYDISVTFGKLSEPFLILNEIENHIRALIEGHFTKEELVQARDPGDSPRPVEDVADLTFGEYVRLLENPLGWRKLGLQIDRAVFINRLDEIRRIRNDVMHFDPEGTDEKDIEKLRDFVEFLRRLRKIS